MILCCVSCSVWPWELVTARTCVYHVCQRASVHHHDVCHRPKTCATILLCATEPVSTIMMCATGLLCATRLLCATIMICTTGLLCATEPVSTIMTWTTRLLTAGHRAALLLGIFYHNSPYLIWYFTWQPWQQLEGSYSIYYTSILSKTHFETRLYHHHSSPDTIVWLPCSLLSCRPESHMCNRKTMYTGSCRLKVMCYHILKKNLKIEIFHVVRRKVTLCLTLNHRTVPFSWCWEIYGSGKLTYHHNHKDCSIS